jgi:hypothetical protein
MPQQQISAQPIAPRPQSQPQDDPNKLLTDMNTRALFNGLLRAGHPNDSSATSVPIVMYALYKTEELEAAAKLAGVRSVVGKEDGVRDLLKAIDVELQARECISSFFP